MESLFTRPRRRRATFVDSMNTPRGFVALMSVIIISAILLLYVFGLGASSFFARFDSLDSEYKRISLGLAESCVNAAMLNIAKDAAYAPSVTETVVVSGGTCVICPGTNSSTVLVRAKHKGTFTNIRASVSVLGGSYTISSWVEEVNGPTTCVLP